jgi:hypothetical protein
MNPAISGYLLVKRDVAVAHCDVTECVTREDILVRIATTLGVATTAVAEQLAVRPLVLVIDNAEHVAAEVATCVEPWLEVAPDLRVVVTARVQLRSTDPAPDAALVIGPGARWFRAFGGAKVELARRRQLRLILAALGAQRSDRPGHALSVDELLASGWPGELVQSEAGASRVYVAISTLRRMGLRELLQRVDSGYLIDPDAAVIAHD